MSSEKRNKSSEMRKRGWGKDPNLRAESHSPNTLFPGWNFDLPEFRQPERGLRKMLRTDQRLQPWVKSKVLGQN